MACYFRLDIAVEDAAAGLDAADDARMVRSFADAAEAAAAAAEAEDAGPADEGAILVAKADYRLLDLDATDAVQRLSDLIGRYMVFRFAIELVLDEAFARADTGTAADAGALRKALEKGLGPHPWPGRARFADDAEALLVQAGELNFPFLDHMDDDEIARLYVDFLTHMPAMAVQREFGLDAVVRLNRALFYDEYDGFICAGVSHVRFDHLITRAARADHDPLVPMEEYVQRGQERAAAAGCQSAAEHLAAFVAADSFQLARCREIHTVLSSGAAIPEWIRADIFRVLEHEAMKQVHAAQVLAQDDGLLLVAGMPALRTALQINASGEVGEMLQRLLRETLSPSGYAGAAGEFAARAQARAAEWQRNGPEQVPKTAC